MTIISDYAAFTPDFVKPILTAKLNSAGIPYLSWTKYTNADTYEVWVSATGKSGSYVRLKTLTTNTFTHTTAVSGKTYYYCVRAIVDGTATGSSAYVVLTTNFVRPLLTVKLGSDGIPYLSWTKYANASSYEVWVSATNKDGSYVRLKTVTTNTFTHSTAVIGKTYYYRVRAIVNGTATGYSAYAAVNLL